MMHLPDTTSPISPPASRHTFGLHLPTLLTGLTLMVVLTVYPPLLTDATGHADHTLASVMLFAMCAGLVRGVGFVPQWWVWRWLFSGRACLAALTWAVWQLLPSGWPSLLTG
jgi:predicted membrane protein